MSSARRLLSVPVPLAIGFSLFVFVLAYLVAASLARRDRPEFEPTRRMPRNAPPLELVRDTVTIDASDARAWRFFDFAAGAVLDPPDTVGWDIAVRRFHIIVADAVSDAGPIRFDSLREAPRDGYTSTVLAPDTVNHALARWYRYDFFAHLLEPKPRVYVVRTRDGRYAKLHVLSYYCTGLRPGCLTLEYAYQGDGTRRLR